jgi:O-antigen ligase
MMLVLFISALFILAAIISPLHGLGLWLFLMITHGLFYQYMGRGAEHLPFLVGLAVLTIFVVRHRWKGITLGLIMLVSTLLILMSVSAFLGINQAASFFSILLYFKGFLLLVLLAGALRTEHEVKIMTLYCIAGLLVGAGFAIYQKMTGTYMINTLYVQRAATLRGDPNDTAMLLVAGIPLCFYWLYSVKHKFVKVAAFASLGTLLTGIVLTDSRGGFVALIVILLAIYLRRPSVRLFASGLFIATFMATIAPHSYWERMKTIVTGKELHLGHSIENREELQKVGLKIVYNNPLVGVGPGNFGQAYLNLVTARELSGFFQKPISEDRTVRAAHNMYLEFFAENGIPCGVLLIVILLLSVRRLLRYDKIVKVQEKKLGLGYCLALALGGMLFAGLFLSQGKNSVLWFMIGIGYAMGTMRMNEPSYEECGIQLSDSSIIDKNPTMTIIGSSEF